MTESYAQQLAKMREEAYSNRIGTVFGTFKITDVRYNENAMSQEWDVACVKCGHTETVLHSVGRDWLRGKGRSRNKCAFCKEKEKIEREKVKLEEQNKKTEAIERQLDSFIGQEINGWLISGRNHNKYQAFCQICGKERNFSKEHVLNRDCFPCRHEKDYSKLEYIGKRYGNLTVLKHMHGKFLVRCDCGFEKIEKPSLLEIGKITTCGRLECKYHISRCYTDGRQQGLIRQQGIKAEIDCYNLLKSLGYAIERTPDSGDYGVDLIAIGRDYSRVAIQVKNNSEANSKVGVSAVQEAYAGGKFYDCSKFAVVSHTGYTDNAKTMADKLGVMLLDANCGLHDFSADCHPNCKHFWFVNGRIEAFSETKRKEGWNATADKLFAAGKNYEQISEEMNRIKQKAERVKLIKESGLSLQMVSYRTNVMGMTLEEAISKPKVAQGRPMKG